MKIRQALTCAMLCSGLIWAACSSERAIWIEMKENGKPGTTIAMTEGIARQLLESKDVNVSLSKTDGDGLITREMLQEVLDGRKASVRTHDEHGSEAIVYAKPLRTPGSTGKDRLVLETRKAGKQVFRIALPQLDIEQADQKSDEFVKVSLGWKALLPFLAKSGGAIYIRDEGDDTEVWVYVE